MLHEPGGQPTMGARCCRFQFLFVPLTTNAGTELETWAYQAMMSIRDPQDRRADV